MRTAHKQVAKDFPVVCVGGATSIPSKAMSHPAPFNGKINWLALGGPDGLHRGFPGAAVIAYDPRAAAC